MRDWATLIAASVGVTQASPLPDLSWNVLGAGGGLYAYNDTLTVTGTQFINNTATDGGGLYLNVSSNPVRVVNVLFARNSARTHGSALYLGSTGVVRILHTTIASPTLGSGVAIYVGAGTVGITNTIVASYTAGIQQMGGTVYEDYNLFFFGDTPDKADTASGGAHDVSGDPLFVNPAGDNYHLTTGSPAIDMGANVGVTTDLDGIARLQGKGYDVGAYEYRFKIYLPLVMRN